MLLNRLRSLTAPWSDASDPDSAVQNGLVGAWLAAKRFDPRRASCFYLYMRNAAEWYAYTTARREKKHQRNRVYPASNDESTEQWIARRVCVGPVAEQRAIDAEAAALINRALSESLDAEEKRAVLCWAGCDHSSQLSGEYRRLAERALRKLRAWFAERGIEQLREIK